MTKPTKSDKNCSFLLFFLGNPTVKRVVLRGLFHAGRAKEWRRLCASFLPFFTEEWRRLCASFLPVLPKTGEDSAHRSCRFPSRREGDSAQSGAGSPSLLYTTLGTQHAGQQYPSLYTPWVHLPATAHCPVPPPYTGC